MHKPPHILCHGFLRSGTANPHAWKDPDPTSIPEVLSNSPNEYVRQLKSEPWTSLPKLLGKNAEKVLIELFLDCGVFRPLESGNNNFLQLSGTKCRFLWPYTEADLDRYPLVRSETFRRASKAEPWRPRRYLERKCEGQSHFSSPAPRSKFYTVCPSPHVVRQTYHECSWPRLLRSTTYTRP